MELTIMDIKRQINSMAYLNTMSYSVLSGCGNIRIPSRKDIVELEPLLQAIPPDQRPFNIHFTESLYKKCMPQYETDIENPYDFSSFKWVIKKRKKVIDIEVMSSSIIACCNLIERLLTFDLQLENANLIIYILQKTVINQMKFIKQYLKIGNIFYNGEDVAEEDGRELHIQIASDCPDRTSQFAVFHAISALIQLSKYDLYYFNYPIEELQEDIDILPGLLVDLINNFEGCSSKELSQIGLHLVEIYKKSEFNTDICRKALNKIYRELCSRTTAAGELQRNKDSEEYASPNTTANCLNLFSQVAYMFASKSCYDASNHLYQSLSSTWDNESGVFKFKSSNKQSYNIKDSAAVLAALFSYSRIVHDVSARDSLQRQIICFTESMLLKSGLFNGQCYPILQQSKMMLYEGLKVDIPWAPVFNKGFEYKINKKKYYCEADVFRADYVLPACAIMLNCVNS